MTIRRTDAPLLNVLFVVADAWTIVCLSGEEARKRLARLEGLLEDGIPHYLVYRGMIRYILSLAKPSMCGAQFGDLFVPLPH